MKKENNSLLIALALLEKIKPQLKMDCRSQISHVGLSNIIQYLGQASTRIAEAEINNIYLMGYLASVIECIDIMLSSNEKGETDTETKNIIIDKVMSCLDELYMEVGKYYTKNEFSYSIRLDPLLRRVVEHCLEKGYYFGLDLSMYDVR